MLYEVSFLRQKYSGIPGWGPGGGHCKEMDHLNPRPRLDGCVRLGFLGRKLSTNSESCPEATALVLAPLVRKLSSALEPSTQEEPRHSRVIRKGSFVSEILS